LSETPNRPNGLPTLTEINASYTLSGNSGTLTPVSGASWYWFRTVGTGLTVQSRSDAPKSAPDVLAILQPSGMEAGGDPPAQIGSEWTAVDTYYEAGWWRVGTGSDYECHGVGVKALGFWMVNGSGSANNQFYAFLDGTGSNAVVTSMPLVFALQNGISRGLSANENVASAVITAGQWYRYEILGTLNTVGSTNGTFQCWLNGVRVFNYADMEWRNATFPTGFYGRKVDCTWGGSSAFPSKTRDDRIEFDHIVIAGA
jgi:hypothetical protein